MNATHNSRFWDEIVKRRLSGKSYDIRKGVLGLAPASTVSTVLDGSKMTCACTISTSSPDWMGDILPPSAFDFSAHVKNPVVMLDHGFTFALPIGKSQDPDGKYTVEAYDSGLKSVTWFSQSLKEAEDAYRLIEEKVLNGVSVSFKAKKADWVTPRDEVEFDWDNPVWPTMGIHFHSVGLLEYSHTPLPQNPEALTELAVRVEKGFGGKPMSSKLRDCFLPYLPVRKSQVTVPVKPPGKNGKRVTKADDYLPDEDDVPVDPETTPPPEEEPVEEEGAADMPPRALALTIAFDGLMELAERLDAQMPKLEPDGKEEIEALWAFFDEKCTEIAETFASLYPDLPPLNGKKSKSEDDGEEKDMDEDETDMDVDPDEEKAARKRYEARLKAMKARKARTSKRLSKAHHKIVSECSEYLLEVSDETNLTKAQKASLKYHGKELAGMTEQPSSDEEEDEKSIAKRVEAKLREEFAAQLEAISDRHEKNNLKLERELRKAKAGR